jgi:serine-type D-Ala-D-Ala carboxypeptidase (penicillin-binding protein 5/6)
MHGHVVYGGAAMRKAVTILILPVMLACLLASPAHATDTVGGARLAGRGYIWDRAPHVAEPPHIQASSYVIADLETGAVLAAKDPHGHYRPASTLKTLTAITLIPKLDPAKKVRPSVKAVDASGSAVGLDVRWDYTVRDLFHGLLMQSGNDTAIALAEAYGGLPKTLAAMNAEAHRIRAADTVARTTNGLDDDPPLTLKQQHSSAYDLALIMKQGLTLPDFRKYVGAKVYKFPAPPTKEDRKKGRKNGDYEIGTHDHLITGDRYPGMIGGKNGWTSHALGSFVGAATRGGHTIIISLMHAQSDFWGDARSLLNWGFAERAKVSPVGTLVDPIPPPPAPKPKRKVAAEPASPAGRGPTGGIQWWQIGLPVAALAIIGGMVIGWRRRLAGAGASGGAGGTGGPTSSGGPAALGAGAPWGDHPPGAPGDATDAGMRPGVATGMDAGVDAAGTDSEMDVGTDSGMDAGTDSGRDSGMGSGPSPGTGLGPSPGTGPGPSPGTGPGADPGTGSGTDAGMGPGAGPEMKADTDADLGTGRDAVRDPGRNTSRDTGVPPWRVPPGDVRVAGEPSSPGGQSLPSSWTTTPDPILPPGRTGGVTPNAPDGDASGGRDAGDGERATPAERDDRWDDPAAAGGAAGAAGAPGTAGTSKTSKTSGTSGTSGTSAADGAGRAGGADRSGTTRDWAVTSPPDDEPVAREYPETPEGSQRPESGETRGSATWWSRELPEDDGSPGDAGGLEPSALDGGLESGATRLGPPPAFGAGSRSASPVADADTEAETAADATDTAAGPNGPRPTDADAAESQPYGAHGGDGTARDERHEDDS